MTDELTTKDGRRIKFADECPPCECCEEPWCTDCEDHYADCACPGPHSEDDDEGLPVRE